MSVLIIQRTDWSLSFETMCNATDNTFRIILKSKKYYAIAYASKMWTGAQLK